MKQSDLLKLRMRRMNVDVISMLIYYGQNPLFVKMMKQLKMMKLVIMRLSVAGSREN